jgi:CheY-like chemotaxis protein
MVRSPARPTVVVLDDDNAVLKTVVALLRRQISFPEEFTIRGFTDSSGMLSWLKKNLARIDVPLLLCDFKLGSEIDGLEVLRRVKGLSPDTRRVLYSAYATRKDLEPAFNDRIVDAFFDYAGLAERGGFSQLINNQLDTWNERRRQARGVCFVMMPFDRRFKATYAGAFKPAIESLGFLCLRADERKTTNRYVVDEILRHIRQASLIVADITLARPSVMYEIGIAHAMAKPVILFSQNRRSCPFDLRNFNVAQYSPGARAYRMIRNEIADVLRSAATGMPQESV